MNIFCNMQKSIQNKIYINKFISYDCILMQINHSNSLNQDYLE